MCFCPHGTNKKTVLALYILGSNASTYVTIGRIHISMGIAMLVLP